MAQKQHCSLEISALSVANYASEQNKIPLVRSVTIQNGDAPVQHAELCITSEPAVCQSFRRCLSPLAPHEAVQLNDIDLRLDGAFLASLTERVTAAVTFCLVEDQTVLCSQTLNLTVLAYDEWQGLGFFPELLAAFVTPNYPGLTALTARAAELLESWEQDPSLDGYQTQDPNRVLAMAAAVYGALQEQNIVYCVPPASFEPAGQRVRLCDTLLRQKIGTCLDLSLLYAGCLEAIGLHPLLIVQKNHIFTGLWLEDLTFPECVQDDCTLLTKRLANGVSEIAVVECTAVTAGKNMSFDLACEAARQALSNGVEAIIDICRTRLGGIHPLPLRVSTDSGWAVQRPEIQRLTDAPQPVRVDSETTADIQPKMVQWERKLLDLGMRNALINMRLSKSVIPLLTDSLDTLENALSDGSDFTIAPRPEEISVDLDSLHTLSHPLLACEFKNKRLRSACTQAELDKALKELYRNAKTALEENGANTLYLVLGLLRWFETPKSTRPRYAPVILLPVEIVRKSAAQGYVVRLRDDDAQINVTMLEKLKQDFGIAVGGLDPLPTDEHGIDVRRVLTVLRKAVMNQQRWDVLESAWLGIFSFSQFVMWNDLRSRDLTKNRIVRSLMDGKLCWPAEDMTIGQKVSEDGVYLPLSADASQLFAIREACAGKSFVLHGPPGTGKSQTITTLIANALAQGKTVLFVAEKRAALEVVQRRLSKIGIGPFCLELHSNKSKKRDVLEQLRAATEVTKGITAEDYAAKAKQISALRQDLDSYADALHAKTESGWSLFDLVNLYEENRYAPDIAPFDPEYAAGLHREALAQQDALTERLAASGRAVGHPHNHPLESICRTQYSQQLRGAIPEQVSGYEASLAALAQPIASLRAATGLPMSSYRQLTQAGSVCTELEKWLKLPPDWAKQESLNHLLTDTEDMANHALRAQELKGRLMQSWKADFLNQDGKALCQSWDDAAEKWFLSRKIGQNGIIRRLKPFMTVPLSDSALREQLGLLAAYQEELPQGSRPDCIDALGALFCDENTDYKAIAQAVATARESADALEQQGAARLRTALWNEPALQNGVSAFQTAWNTHLSVREEFYRLLAVSCDPDAECYVNQQLALCAALRTHAADLKDWIAWNSIAEEAAQAGLGNLVDAYRGGLPHEQLSSAYRKAVSKAIAMTVIDGSEALRTFSGAVFDEKIRQFRKLDAQFTELTQQEIYCHLAKKVPNFTQEAAHSSELGILQRAIRSGGRGVSLRRLFEQIPNLLPRLCPCMLMSPISAAQYLEPSRTPFDLVVFDEASQLPTCKAVGALARAENAVIVGDPKQMPPTAFFVTNTMDEDNLESEDLESILDDCLALNIPQTHLLWHYRSRHESLIAFSNQTFYENKLYTFPSTNDRVSKVNLVHVDGVFERSSRRQNRAEAEAVVAELKRRCHDAPEESVGVVTFNISQQRLIDDLLSDACRDDPALDTWAYQSEEPVFIKNLENVQGDERDVILFSIGYGPDEHGKVYMNFGPLNRDGGWRRLNVAVTRARQEMTVFSTLRPEQIDLSRSSAQGVSALKAFLEYAERQKLPLAESTGKAACPGGIVQSICAFLAGNGYETAQNVGHSQYRIDIGVMDPQNPERYILGILLDGDSYGQAKTTRDREIAQIGVLNGLGWRITRVWTMDWWDNGDRERQRLLKLLSQPQTAAAPEPAPQEKLASGIIPVTPVDDHQVYAPVALKEDSVSAEDFLLPKYAAAIRKKILRVLEHEAPISASVLTKRILQSYGIARAGSRIQSYLEGIYRSLALKTTRQGSELFYWDAEQDPEEYFTFRASGSEETRREPKDIPVQEAAAAAVQALTEQISLSNEDLVREAGKLLGYPRTGSAIAALLSEGIRYAQWKGKILTAANGNWVLA